MFISWFITDLDLNQIRTILRLEKRNTLIYFKRLGSKSFTWWFVESIDTDVCVFAFCSFSVNTGVGGIHLHKLMTMALVD